MKDKTSITRLGGGSKDGEKRLKKTKMHEERRKRKNEGRKEGRREDRDKILIQI